MTNLFIAPKFRGVDKGDGGIRRVVEAQHKYLPQYGINIVDNVEEADLVATHAGLWVETNKPVVSHCHGLYWNEYEWPKWSHDLNNHVVDAIKKADFVTAPSGWVAHAIRRGMLIDASVIGHGIDKDEWTPGENEGYILWNKTRVDPVCNPEPVNKLADLLPNVNFVTTFGTLTKNVKVTGRLPFEVGKHLINNAGIYLCTSRETFGIGTLEAMSCGVPILGWAWGAQTEIVKHKVNGWLARPGDYDSLVEGYKFCVANRTRLGQAAREMAPTWKDVMPLYVDVYNKALEVKHTGPKVSVIIPCYNLAEFLPDAVKSVQLQRFNDLEILIVDDCSTDNTLAIANSLANNDSRIRVIHSSINRYLAGALNFGISQARGEYIVPLDADNMLGPNALELMVQPLEKSRDIDITYGSMQIIEPDGREWVSSWPPESFDFEAQMGHRNQCPSTSMYRKRVWSRIGGYRRRCHTGEDADFWCRATSFGFIPKKVTSAVTLIYRNREDSMSHVEKDWDWTAWYIWNRKIDLSPSPAPVLPRNIPTFNPPIISVIIPVGPNHEEIVIDAIDSLISQTFTKFEVIVVNDSGKEILWLPPFVKLLRTEGDGGKGPAHARNLGIAVSSGSLFVPLDADDYLTPGALSSLYYTWLETKGFVYSDWIVQETQEVHEAPDYNCKEVLQHLQHAVTALYPKQAWQDVGGFDEQLDAWEDWDFAIALAVAGYCGTRVSEPLIYYRMKSGNRREQLYARRDELKELIFDKWHKYIKEGEITMACRGCGKGGGTTIPSVKKLSSAHAVSGDMMLLEFTKVGAGTVTYKGAATGTLYRFGSDPSHKVKYVHKSDGEVLMRRSEFRLAKI